MPFMSFPTAFYGILSVLSYQLLFLSQRPVNLGVIVCVLMCAYAISRMVTNPEDGIKFTAEVCENVKGMGQSGLILLKNGVFAVYEKYFEDTTEA